MARHAVQSRSVAATLLVLVLALAIGCGNADPFVGTWQYASNKQHDAAEIIAKTQAGYTVSWFNFVKREWVKTPAVFTRQGSKLIGTYSSGSHSVTWVYTYQPGSGHLLEHNTAFLGLPAHSNELSRISGSTEYPNGQ